MQIIRQLRNKFQDWIRKNLIFLNLRKVDIVEIVITIQNKNRYCRNSENDVKLMYTLFYVNRFALN